jgi:hypothetical protein
MKPGSPSSHTCHGAELPSLVGAELPSLVVAAANIIVVLCELACRGAGVAKDIVVVAGSL